MNATNTNPQELTLLKEKFVLEVTQILNDQQALAAEHAKLEEAVRQSKQSNDSREFTVKLTDLLDITRISDELSRKERDLEKRTRKLFHAVSPSNMFISQEYFDAWIAIDETKAVRFDYEADRIVVREEATRVS
jgi:hypothetical protein